MNATTTPTIQRVRSLLIKAGFVPCRYDEGRHPISAGFQIWKSQYRDGDGPRFIAVQWVDERIRSYEMDADDYRETAARHLPLYREVIRSAGIGVFIIDRLVWIPLPA